MLEGGVVSAVERLEKAVDRLELMVNGSEELQLGGLTDKIADHDQRLRRLEMRTPNPYQWALGFFVFVLVVFVVADADVSFFPLLPPVQVGLIAVLGALVSMLLFLGGFGWFKSRS